MKPIEEFLKEYSSINKTLVIIISNSQSQIYNSIKMKKFQK